MENTRIFEGLMGVKGDAATGWQWGLQDPGTSVGEELMYFYDTLFFYQLVIAVVVGVMLTIVVVEGGRRVQASKYDTHGGTIEMIWTIVPAVVLVIISLPSFQLLYLMDSVVEPSLTVKAIGRQWYWTYEYSDYSKELEFDSYMVGEADLEEGDLRLLEVDNAVVLPVRTHIRVIVTGGDVVHSWAVPSLGVKIDAIPGRLNGVSLLIKREGDYYGQCSELCGTQHGMMPIVVRGVKLSEYVEWVGSV